MAFISYTPNTAPEGGLRTLSHAAPKGGKRNWAAEKKRGRTKQPPAPPGPFLLLPGFFLPNCVTLGPASSSFPLISHQSVSSFIRRRQLPAKPVEFFRLARVSPSTAFSSSLSLYSDSIFDRMMIYSPVISQLFANSRPVTLKHNRHSSIVILHSLCSAGHRERWLYSIQ